MHDAALPGLTRRGTAWAVAVIVFVALLAYHNSFQGVLLLDDHPTIENNASIRDVWSTAVLSPPANVGTAGRPVANISFALNYAVGRLSVRGYHIVNLAIHILTALFLFGLVRRTLRLAAVATPLRDQANALALFAALLWVAHPLTTETVTYISQRTEALAACAYVATLYCMVRYASGGGVRWAVAGVVSCALGMASKETMVTAPVATLLFDAAFVTGSWRRTWRDRWPWYLALALSWVALAGLMATARLSVRGVGFGQGMTVPAYALVECRALLTYLKLSLWPHPLVFDYGWPAPVSTGIVIAAVVVVVLGLAFVARLARAGRGSGWLAVLWLLMLAPTSSVIPIAEQPVAENRTYLPLAIVTTGALLLLYRLVGTRAWIVAAAVVAALVGMTIQRNRVYQFEDGVWRDVLRVRPTNPRAFNMLGMLALKSGDISRALRLHERALALRPGYAEAEGNLGADLLYAGRPADAVAHFRQAMQLDPNLPGIRSNLGNALLAAGDVSEALAQLKIVVGQNPDDPNAHMSIARALARAGALDEAIAEFERVLQLDPGYPQAHLALGNARLQKNDPRGAAREYETALRENSADAAAQNNLAFASLQLGDANAALAHALEALRLQPRYAAANANAANALLQLGRLDDAMEQFRAAIAVDPQNAATYNGLGIALARRGRTEEAIDAFRSALRITPGYGPATENLTQLQKELGTSARQ